MTGWRDRPLADLLRDHGLEGASEAHLYTDGWSGATFTRLARPSAADDAARFVLKRDSLARDWIARATLDHELREATIVDAALEAGWFATRDRGSIAFPYLGAAADGDGSAVLMPDLSAELLAWEAPGRDGPMEPDLVGRVLDGIARLHAGGWWASAAARAVPWCPVDRRLTLLGRSSAEGYRAEGNPVGATFLAGWEAFDRLAPAATRDLVDRLGRDAEPLVRALERLPATGLHGDLKLANVAVFDDGRIGFIDWQMTTIAPVAVELGWLLVSNVAALPFGPVETLDRYRKSVGIGRGGTAEADLVGDWAAQVDLAWIVGLVLRGWRKGLDAEAGIRLADGTAAADDLATWCRQAVEAAERRLA